MSRIEKKYFHDILASIRIIFEDFIVGVDTLEQYKADPKPQAAVERMLIVIGEAMYNLRRQGIILSSGD